MNTNSENKIILRGGQISDFVARLIFKAIFVTACILIYSTVQIFRVGLSNKYLILIFVSILSIVEMIAYIFVEFMMATGNRQKSWTKALILFGGFIPYLFGCYLVFYEGLYRLRLLASGFSFRILIISCMYVIAGFVIVKSIYNITEFGKRLDEGKIVIENSQNHTSV